MKHWIKANSKNTHRPIRQTSTWGLYVCVCNLFSPIRRVNDLMMASFTCDFIVAHKSTNERREIGLKSMHLIDSAWIVFIFDSAINALKLIWFDFDGQIWRTWTRLMRWLCHFGFEIGFQLTLQLKSQKQSKEIESNYTFAMLIKPTKWSDRMHFDWSCQMNFQFEKYYRFSHSQSLLNK